MLYLFRYIFPFEIYCRHDSLQSAKNFIFEDVISLKINCATLWKFIFYMKYVIDI